LLNAIQGIHNFANRFGPGCRGGLFRPAAEAEKGEDRHSVVGGECAALLSIERTPARAESRIDGLTRCRPRAQKDARWPSGPIGWFAPHARCNLPAFEIH